MERVAHESGLMVSRRAFLRRSAQLALSALSGGLGGFVGCSSTVAPTTTPTAMPDSVERSTSLLLWHGWSGTDRRALGMLVERFNRLHSPNSVVLQSVSLATFASELATAIAAGSGPHLILVPHTWIGKLVQDGALLAFDDSLPFEREAMLASTLGAVQISTNGQTQFFGTPLRIDTLALYYNAANVLASPTDTLSMFTSARGLSAPDAKPAIWGFALNMALDVTISYLYAFGSRIFDEAGSLVLGSSGRAGAERWLGWLQELANDPRMFIRPESSIMVDQELRSGHALMTFDWAHRLGQYQALWGEKCGVGALPALSETNQAPRASVYVDMLALNARLTGYNRERALDFMRFATGEEAQSMLLTNALQPARRVPLSDSALHQVASVFRAQAEYGIPMPNRADHDILNQELRLMQQQVLLGITSPADAVTDADQRLRERLGV